MMLGYRSAGACDAPGVRAMARIETPIGMGMRTTTWRSAENTLVSIPLNSLGCRATECIVADPRKRLSARSAIRAIAIGGSRMKLKCVR